MLKDINGQVLYVGDTIVYPSRLRRGKLQLVIGEISKLYRVAYYPNGWLQPRAYDIKMSVQPIRDSHGNDLSRNIRRSVSAERVLKINV